MAQKSFQTKFTLAAKVVGSEEFERFSRQLSGLSSSSQRLAREFKGLDASSGVRASAKSVKELDTSFGSVLSKVDRYKVGIVGATLAVAGFVQSLQRVLAVQQKIDQLNSVLNVVNNNDIQKTAQDIEYLKQTTDRLGLSFTKTAELYGKVAAAAKNTSLEGEGVRKVFDAFSGTIGRLNLSADSSNRIFFALQQIISKNVVSSEELKNQLGEKIPGIMNIAARSIGKTTSELQKMLENGEVMAGEFLPKLAKELGVTFGVDSQTRIDTATASLNRFNNAIDELQRAVVGGGLGDALANEFETSAKFIRDLASIFEVANEALEGFFGTASEAEKLNEGFSESAYALGVAMEAVAVLGANVGFVLKTLADTAITGARQLAAVATLEFREAARLGVEYEARSAAARQSLDEFEKRIVGSTDKARRLAELRDLYNRSAYSGVDDGKDTFMGNPEKVKELTEEEKKLIEQREKFLARYATDQEKLNAELSKAAELFGGILPPGLEKKIRDRFIKPVKETSGANRELEKALEAVEKQQERDANTRKKSIETLVDSNDQIQRQIERLGLSRSEIAALDAQEAQLTANRLRRKAQEAQDAVEADAEGASPQKVQDLLRQAEEYERKAKLIRTKAAKETAIEIEDVNAEVAKQFEDDLIDAFETAFLRGGSFAESFKRAIENQFAQMVLRPVISAFVAPISGVLSGVLGGGAGGAGGAAGQALSAASGLSSAYKAVSLGFEGFATEIFSASSNLAQLAGASRATATSIGGVASAVGTVAAGAGIGVFGGRAISGGFAVSGSGNGIVNAGTAIGAALGSVGGPIGTAIGAALGGIAGGTVNRLFGRRPFRTEAEGITGSFGAGGFDGSYFLDQRSEGGLFRSDRRRTLLNALDPQTERAFDASVQALFDNFEQASRLLEVDLSKAVDQFTVSGRFAVKEAGDLNDVLNQVADSLVLQAIPNLKDFQQEGENLVQTATRLGIAVDTTNDIFTALGRVVAEQQVSFQFAESFVNTLGGSVQNLGVLMEFLYNETEIAAIKATLLDDALADAGLQFTTTGKTSDELTQELKDLVGGIDLTTEAGQRELATLLSVFPELQALIGLREQEEQRVKQQATAIEQSIQQVGQSYENYIAQIQGTTNSLNFDRFYATLITAEANITELGETFAETADPAVADQLRNAIVERYNLELAMLDQLFGSVQNLKQSIAGVRADVSGSAEQILGVRQRSISEITGDVRGIEQASTLSDFNQALAELEAAQLAKDAIDAAVASSRIASDKATAEARAGYFEIDKLIRTGQNARLLGGTLESYNGGNKVVTGTDSQGRPITESNVSMFLRSDLVTNARNSVNANGGTRFNTSITENDGQFKFNLDSLRAVFFGNENFFKDNQNNANAYFQNIGESLGVFITNINNGLRQTAINQGNLLAANLTEQLKLTKELTKEQGEFAVVSEEFQDFIIESGKLVDQLSSLRAETVAYYQAQQQLSNVMNSSAQSLRDTIKQVRFDDLGAIDQLSQLRSEFESLASAAGSTTDGERLASIGSELNALIGPILEKGAEVFASGSQFQDLKESVLATADSIAEQLEELAPRNFEQESLEALDLIDQSLRLIEENTKSAEKLIVDAIGLGADRTVNALAELYRGITGEQAPAFAMGGMHSGGIRLVGERGPELEVTGPSRIIPNNQLMGMMRPNNNADVVSELRESNRLLMGQMRVLQASAQQQMADNAEMKAELQMLRKKAQLAGAE